MEQKDVSEQQDARIRDGKYFNHSEVMAMTVPAGFGTVTPYMFVEKAESFIEFLVAAFGGQEIGRTVDKGRIQHAQVSIGSSTLMISEATADYKANPGAYYLYVNDVDAAMRRALDHGATLQMDIVDAPYGDRQGGVRDPFGNIWWIAQRMVDEPYY